MMLVNTGEAEITAESQDKFSSTALSAANHTRVQEPASSGGGNTSNLCEQGQHGNSLSNYIYN